MVNSHRLWDDLKITINIHGIIVEKLKQNADDYDVQTILPKMEKVTRKSLVEIFNILNEYDNAIRGSLWRV